MYRISHCSYMYDTNVKPLVTTHEYMKDFSDESRVQAEKCLKYTS